MRYLVLQEYRTDSGIALLPGECDALRSFAPSVTITPSLGAAGHYDLTPGSWIGAVSLPGIAIEIRPKIPVGRVMFLVSYALDPRRWRDTGFDFGQESSILESVIPGFAAQLRTAVGRGMLQGYRLVEDALVTVRGRVRIDDQVRKRFGLLPPVEVRFDEFTEDIEENRLLRAALNRLGQLPIRSQYARRLLAHFEQVFARVTLVEYDVRALPAIGYSRLNEHYRPAVELAKLILRSASIEVRHGGVRSSAFLIDMDAVFEDFLTVALREALGLAERVFPQGARGRELRLDSARLVHLRPDLSWWEDGRCTFVGDVKYKRVVATGVEHPDLYQLLAYAVAARLPGGLLIYAAGEADGRTHRIPYADKELEVVPLGLYGAPEEILQEVKGLAGRVRLLREKALQGVVAA